MVYRCLENKEGVNGPRDVSEFHFVLGLESENTPKTLHDAITVARGLEVRYVGVNALCIVQDSIQDWTREAAKMHKVYGGAALIPSICSSSDVSEAFLGDSEEEPLSLHFHG